MRILLHQHWWKYITVCLMFYTIIGGFLIPVPALVTLHESIRNLFYHVPMWFGMVILLFVGMVYGIAYLRTRKAIYDILAAQMTQVAVWFGMLGLFTGMIWANYTWGEAWSNDPKQLASAIGLLMYFAYFVLRSAIYDDQKRATVSSVYGIFAFFLFIVLIGVLPRITASLHPGATGNPAFSKYDIENNLLLVFYPAILAWTGLGFWLVSLSVRYHLAKRKIAEQQQAQAPTIITTEL